MGLRYEVSGSGNDCAERAWGGLSRLLNKEDRRGGGWNMLPAPTFILSMLCLGRVSFRGLSAGFTAGVGGGGEVGRALRRKGLLNLDEVVAMDVCVAFEWALLYGCAELAGEDEGAAWGDNTTKPVSGDSLCRLSDLEAVEGGLFCSRVPSRLSLREKIPRRGMEDR